MTPASNKKTRNGLAAFRRVELPALEAIAGGETVAATYARFGKALHLSYSQFRRHLRRAQSRGPGASRPTAAQPRANRQGTAPIVERQEAGRREGPLRGRPEDVINTENMDDFATKTLSNRDLI